MDWAWHASEPLPLARVAGSRPLGHRVDDDRRKAIHRKAIGRLNPMLRGLDFDIVPGMSSDGSSDGDSGMSKRLTNGEFALAVLVASLFWIAVLAWATSYAPTDPEKRSCYQAAEKSGRSIVECKSFWEKTTSDPVAMFTLVLAVSTVGLWIATIGLYLAGKSQLAHAQSESEAADFHRTTQFEQISAQIEALQQSAAAAEENVFQTHRLAQNAEITAQRQLRAYIVADAKSVDIRGPENEVWISVQIVIKNTGQTPAHDLRVVSKTELLQHPMKMPFDFTLISGPDPSVAVLGAGEPTESESRPEKPFDGNEMMVAREPESGARIYTWGTITYRDVFGSDHYTNFCSSLIFAHGEAIAHASEHHNDAS